MRLWNPRSYSVIKKTSRFRFKAIGHHAQNEIRLRACGRQERDQHLRGRCLQEIVEVHESTLAALDVERTDGPRKGQLPLVGIVEIKREARKLSGEGGKRRAQIAVADL